MRLKNYCMSWFSSFASDRKYSMVQMTLRLLYESTNITQIVLCNGITVIQLPSSILIFTNSLNGPAWAHWVIYRSRFLSVNKKNTPIFVIYIKS